ncbi:MAG: sugar phosphate isomerase/epimerase [Deltaproteobacteria bacterium]|nr:sugar phosphate isomerase/epimerase [Deltaproteobacteria bacterium]MBW2119231.1 sugar phosphate isomerase/epimerase [Deltaproteobacteria bacterium]MBW2342693.1 sugar phosphate isomerase/epimerase [Deltaproteobacteria bacterium]
MDTTNDKQSIHLGGTARSPEDVMALHELGLQFAEIPIIDPEKFQSLKDTYIDLKKKTGLYYLCHGPREGDPNDIETLESIYMPKLVQVLSIMPDLDMRLLTIHLWLDPRFLTPDAIAYKIGFLKRLIEIATDAGITICLENLSETATHLAGVFKTLPHLNMTLDMGHAQLLSKQNTSYGFMKKHLDRIKHIHVHDNRGGNSPDDDLHLPVGEGIVDFKRIFQQLKGIGYCGTMTLELRPWEIRKCLGYVKQLLFPLTPTLPLVSRL